jgi:hypothetical protein
MVAVAVCSLSLELCCVGLFETAGWLGFLDFLEKRKVGIRLNLMVMCSPFWLQR